MTKVALRGIAARKLRAFTTWLAIFLGVALVAGTYVLTDTINQSFNEIFTESLKGTDVVVTARQDIQTDDAAAPGFPARLLGRVKKVDGVDAAAGSVFASGRFIDTKGDPIGNSFAPNFISSLLPPRFEALDYVAGRKPRTSTEASIDTQTADTGHLKLGGKLRLAGAREAKTYDLVGLTQLGNASFGGAGIAQVVLPEAQRITDHVGQFDQISVAAAQGVSPEELRDRIARVMPRQVQVETGEEAAQRQSDDIAQGLGFLRIALLVFAGVSLFVGAFQIFNTFSITVAQRTREFGMLRTLGASRGQILATVGLEALTLGLLGAVLGLAGGVGFAFGINELFKAVGIDLPNTGTVVTIRTVIVSLIVGVVVTVVAALVPALRATRVTPMAALREADLQDTKKRGRIVTAVAVLVGVVGLAMMLVGLFGGIEDSGSAAGLLGGGAALMLFGVSLFSPRLVRPLASLTGRPLERLRGITGRLARENAMRKPGRTATTAAALMIGLALVVFVTIFAAGLKTSVAKTIDESFRGEIVLQNSDGFSPIPRDAVERARQVDGVATVSSITYATGKVPRGGPTVRVAAVDPSTLGQVLALTFKSGDPSVLRGLGPHDAIVDDAFARDQGLAIGDTLRLRTPIERTATFRVRATIEGELDLLGKAVVDESATRFFGRLQPSFALARLRPDASPKEVQKAIDDAVKDRYPTVEVQNQSQLKDQQEQQVNALLGLVYALLSLAVIVSLFGIVNTLALSIHERTRELGMLRAVGMSRRQVRTMVRYEAVITALIGAILGTVLGVIFAALVSRPLADEGFQLSYPIPTLIVLLVLAALAGVVAAIGPARRASRLDVLKALAYE
ncbi:MAG: putative transport system permease protein [Thermoleophilaceae bacterium]|nr:putative transport system permease protein [Thermoleophilaceae bacterium]